MSNSTILLVPFPTSRSSIPSFDARFGPNSSQISSLAAATRSPAPIPSSFAQYLQALKRAPHTNLHCRWAHPLNPSIVVDSPRLEAEICGTLWNFLACLHAKIREIEVGDVERLKAIRRLISDCFACGANFTLISSKFDHQFFTPALAAFIEQYNRYIASVWQIECAICAGKNDPESATRWSIPCLQTAKECETALGRLDVPFRNGLRDPFLGFRVYFTSFLLLHRGKAVFEAEKGLALAYFRASAAAFDGVTISHADTILLTALGRIRHLAFSARDDLERRHKAIHFARVPAQLPALPAGAAVPNIPPNNDLLFVPQQGKPASAAPSSAANGFPEWDRVKSLKANARAHFDRLLANPAPNISGLASMLLTPVRNADEADRVLENQIAAFNRGTNEFIREDILQGINGSMAFYASLETKLNQLETRSS